MAQAAQSEGPCRPGGGSDADLCQRGTPTGDSREAIESIWEGEGGAGYERKCTSKDPAECHSVLVHVGMLGIIRDTCEIVWALTCIGTRSMMFCAYASVIHCVWLRCIHVWYWRWEGADMWSVSGLKGGGALICIYDG